MSGTLNEATLIGHLGKDPEIRNTQDGRPIANFSIATSERWKDKNTGEKRERTEWHRIVVFNENLAKICEQYLKKGSKVFIRGAIQTRKWQDQSGNDKYTTEIVLQGYHSQLIMLNKVSGRDDADTDHEQERAAPKTQRPRGADMDDDIPF